jgi:hypothetical protein
MYSLSHRERVAKGRVREQGRVQQTTIPKPRTVKKLDGRKT